MNDLQMFVFLSKYARFDWENMRRETWEEAVYRVMAFLKESSDMMLPLALYDEIENAALNMDVAFSMRLLNQAGDAAKANGLGIFNCAYIPITSPKSFAELTFALLSGTGVGLSVELQNIQHIDPVKEYSGQVIGHYVADTSEGWADAVVAVISEMIDGNRVAVNYSKVRGAGEPLMTKGGVSAGPEPLKRTISAIKEIIEGRRGKYLRSIDAYDIACWIAEGVVSGGNRRSALLTAFSWNDSDMLGAKTGGWFITNPQRQNSNNSAVLPEDYFNFEVRKFFEDMLSSDSGEPGIINPVAYWNNMPVERKALFDMRTVVNEWRTNPCGEVILQPHQTCNLSMAVTRPGDSAEDVINKVMLATVIGVLQADVTNFSYIGQEWQDVLESERILGVSLSGFAENEYLMQPDVLEGLRDFAVKVADEASEMLGMQAPTAVTTVKPSGNSSLLYGVGSGIHAWHAPYFLRNTMVKTGSPIYNLLAAHEVPMSEMKMKPGFHLIHFPVKAPEGAITRRDITAEEQLERWSIIQRNYADHAVSATITYNEDEIPGMVQWLLDNISIITGLSFIKNDDTTYSQMPIEEISQEEYEQRVANWPTIDWSMLSLFEGTDMTESAGEIACASGACEVDYS